MVAPTYYLAAGIFKGVSPHIALLTVDCGYSDRITGIPEDEEGLDLSVFQSHLDIFEKDVDVEKPKWQKWTYRYVFYGVPTFSNPTGSIMSLSRRTQILGVCSTPCI
jgi:DNA-binding transcriptional MocR family regulator